MQCALDTLQSTVDYSRPEMTGSRILTSLLVFAASGGSALAGSFQVRGSLRQFFVIGASPGASVELLDQTGLQVQEGPTDALGGLVFRNVEPGEGYVAAVTVKGETLFSEPTRVLAEKDVPPQSFYDSQVLPVGIYGSAGYGYLTTRDGTQLSVQVQLPIFGGGRAGETYPTVIEYSGYDPSNPAPDDLLGGRINEFRLIAALLGYAYVGVNMRGTGCSGGAFDYFEPLQSVDGYDIVEVVAAQRWVQYGRPGMVGISYSGISQLFVAQTRPPHLAAITPLSVIDDTFRGTLYPGGIFNDGFALSWAIERQQQNQWPDPVGADWVVNRVNEGDASCAENQLLRQQNPDLLAKIERNPFYPEVGNPEYPGGGDMLAPFAFVRQINVPTFMVGAWQDDQTGGHWSVMLDQFDSATELRVVANNGTHADSLGPVNLLRLLEFLDFRVAGRLPIVPLEVRGLAPLLYSLVFGADGVQLPPDRFAEYTYEQALAIYDQEDRFHISWESGAKPGAQTLGSPEPAAESSYAQWPPAETVAQRLYLQPEGGLTADPPSIPDDDPHAIDAYQYDLSAKPRTDFRCPGGGDPNTCRSELWRAGVRYDWRPLPVDYTLYSQRSAPRRSGALCAEWLAASQSSPSRRGTLNRASTAPNPLGSRLRASTQERLRLRPRGNLPLRARVPTGVATKTQRRGAGREPAALDVRRAHRKGHHELDRPLRPSTVERGSACGFGHRSARRASPLPYFSARAAVSPLPVNQPPRVCISRCGSA